jgi:hypothetical protein
MYIFFHFRKKIVIAAFCFPAVHYFSCFVRWIQNIKTKYLFWDKSFFFSSSSFPPLSLSVSYVVVDLQEKS